MKKRQASFLIVDQAMCLSCGACVGICSYGALTLNGVHLVIDNTACTTCGFCVDICPAGALDLVSGAGDEGTA